MNIDYNDLSFPNAIVKKYTAYGLDEMDCMVLLVSDNLLRIEKTLLTCDILSSYMKARKEDIDTALSHLLSKGIVEIVDGGNGPLANGVLETVLPLHPDIRARHVMQERGKKGHIIGETQPRALPARRADGLAQAAIERLVEHEVLNTQVGQIVANISEHALFSPIKSHFAVHFGKRLARRAEGIFLAAL